MSKTVGLILTIAAVALAVAVPIIGPTALAAIGLSTATAAAISAGLSAAIMINGLLMPKGDPNLRQRQASVTTLQLGEQPRVAIFGAVAASE